MERRSHTSRVQPLGRSAGPAALALHQREETKQVGQHGWRPVRHRGKDSAVQSGGLGHGGLTDDSVEVLFPQRGEGGHRRYLRERGQPLIEIQVRDLRRPQLLLVIAQAPEVGGRANRRKVRIRQRRGGRVPPDPSVQRPAASQPCVSTELMPVVAVALPPARCRWPLVRARR